MKRRRLLMTLALALALATTFAACGGNDVTTTSTSSSTTSSATTTTSSQTTPPPVVIPPTQPTEATVYGLDKNAPVKLTGRSAVLGTPGLRPLATTATYDGVALDHSASAMPFTGTFGGDVDLPIVWATGMMGQALSDWAKNAIDAMNDENLYQIRTLEQSRGAHNGHPTIDGHQNAAEALVAFLQENELVPNE